MKATKIRSEIFGALFAPRRCLSMAQCDLMKKIQEKKKKEDFRDGTCTVLESWSIAGFMASVASCSTKNPCQERDTSRSFCRALERSAPTVKNNTLLAWLFIAHRLSTFASFIVLFVSSLHDCIVSLVCRQRSCRFRTTTSALLPPIHPFFHVF